MVLAVALPQLGQGRLLRGKLCFKVRARTGGQSASAHRIDLLAQRNHVRMARVVYVRTFSRIHPPAHAMYPVLAPMARACCSCCRMKRAVLLLRAQVTFDRLQILIGHILDVQIRLRRVGQPIEILLLEARQACLAFRDFSLLSVRLALVEATLVDHLSGRSATPVDDECIRKPRRNLLRNLGIRVHISDGKSSIDIALQSCLRIENLLRDHLDLHVALQPLQRSDSDRP